ncbi:restriction endonuclease subunit S [Desulfomicrobium sp. ZS1]|jgi:type I restriction enzyme S subunit|uniref:restriction endonuclease subunit S n=1 Tax=Desulfomicrobium sp. ZS1 TaxID=2952228 RepID=UPI0020B4268F|nr:restriction endonuclease subunit S [Desulfomicrobium sp. ZS1]UTF49811.1 restriction endonuclease subunit S [Desulfomicrobium sp. ZS1]
MNPNLFLADFGHIVNAPGGISRLREMIYNLAVTGALSEQRRSDGDGHALLEEITAKKQALSDAGKYKRSPKLENFRDAYNENLPKVPATWAWSRLVEVGEISPRNEAEDDSTASFASMSAISEMHSSAVTSEDRPWGSIKKGYTHFANGDVVLAKITPCFENGKAAVMVNLTNGIGAGTTELHVVRPIAGVIEPGYIYVFLRSPYFKIVGEGHMTGTAGQKRLPTEYFATRPFPLPPLAEQKRIVAKVDELMALCDQLEAQQLERERRFPVLSRTCHARFAEAPTPDNLNRIFDEVGAVSPADIKRMILTLAAHGKLVAQDPREESATKLLERVAVKREQLLKNGYPNSDEAKSQLRKQHAQHLPEGLQDLPVGWKWATLMQASLLVVDCHNKTAPYVSSGIRLIRTTNIRAGQLNALEPKYVSEATYERWSARCKPEPGDILVTREAPMGEVCIIPQGVKLCMGQRMMLIRLAPDTVDVNFLLYSLMDPELMQRVQDKPIGATVQHLRVGGVETLLVAIPPLAEQRRIVAKVDELMVLVDQLEAQQQERDKLAEAFAKACVASFTGTSQLERPEKMRIFEEAPHA